MEIPLEDIRKKTTRKTIKVGNSVAVILHQDEREHLGGIEHGDEMKLILTHQGELILGKVADGHEARPFD